MNSRYFSIEFSDLSFEKQQEMIQDIKNDLIPIWKLEMESKKNIEPYKDMSWEEIYCRIYVVDYIMWETDEEAKKFDWEFAVDQEAERVAEEKCNKAMHLDNMEVKYE